MALNKHGWGMKEMIVFSSVLLLFLLIAVFYILRLYNGIGRNNTYKNSSSESYSYTEIEDKLLNAGINYYQEYYEEGMDVRITTSMLKKHGYLKASDLKEKNEKKECTGYVLVENMEVFSFIQCPNYETIGFEG